MTKVLPIKKNNNNNKKEFLSTYTIGTCYLTDECTAKVRDFFYLHHFDPKILFLKSISYKNWFIFRVDRRVGPVPKGLESAVSLSWSVAAPTVKM